MAYSPSGETGMSNNTQNMWAYLYEKNILVNPKESVLSSVT